MFKSKSMSALKLPTAKDIEQAVQLLRKGKLVAFPTETVYGLGADASSAEAVAKIFKTKGRPSDHPVIVHLANSEDIGDWAKDIPEEAWQLAEAFWPGPLTLILKKQDHVLDAVTGGQDSVGLRVPSHPVAQALLKDFKGGLAAPSANRFGHISPTSAEHVKADFPDAELMVLDGGDSDVGLESTIVDLTRAKPRVLRPGGISVSALKAVLPIIEFVGEQPGTEIVEGGVVGNTSDDNRGARANELRASGLLDKHYAPKVKTFLVPNLIRALKSELGNSVNDIKSIGVIACETAEPSSSRVKVWIQLSTLPESYAQHLYSSMRQLEEHVDEIWIEAVPEDKAWLAVKDRLQRATEAFEI